MAPADPVHPDNTAVRTALWRALHVELDAQPHVLEDEIGLALAAPDVGWRGRGDMHPEGTRPFRASIVARARFVEDLVEAEAAKGVRQYVLLGAGIDTFAQRRPDVASRLSVFEVDRPGAQAWKRERLVTLGYGVPDSLKLVGVDFEAGENAWTRLAEAGFDSARPAIVAAVGLSMYLARETVAALLRKAASLASGSTLAMTFLLPIDMVDQTLRPVFEMSIKGAEAAGTPFRSCFTPEEMLSLAREAGLTETRHVSGGELTERYFTGRGDGLRPPRSGEEILVART
ncbi:MAG TPA: class I SAM-dependent methyltransferase [Caulobacteraceae bacterium]|nr:class I SAM-dependent methyltransferase [Caulobacteraceae bacterium]